MEPYKKRQGEYETKKHVPNGKTKCVWGEYYQIAKWQLCDHLKCINMEINYTDKFQKQNKCLGKQV